MENGDYSFFIWRLCKYIIPRGSLYKALLMENYRFITCTLRTLNQTFHRPKTKILFKLPILPSTGKRQLK